MVGLSRCHDALGLPSVCAFMVIVISFLLFTTQTYFMLIDWVWVWVAGLNKRLTCVIVTRIKIKKWRSFSLKSWQKDYLWTLYWHLFLFLIWMALEEVHKKQWNVSLANHSVELRYWRQTGICQKMIILPNRFFAKLVYRFKFLNLAEAEFLIVMHTFITSNIDSDIIMPV